MKLLIKNAQIYDPARSLSGIVADLAIADGWLVPTRELGSPDRIIDADALAVTAAAVEASAHAAPLETLLLQQRFGFPPLAETARRYAQRGYCHLHQNFTTAQTVAATLGQLGSQRWLDTSHGLAVPLYDLESRLGEGNVDQAAQELEVLMTAARARSLYLVEPRLAYRLEVYQHKNRGPETVLPFLGEARRRIGCAVYLPGANLGPQALGMLDSGFHIERWGSPSPTAPSGKELATAGSVTFDLGLPCEATALVRSWQTGTSSAAGVTFDFGFYPCSVWERLTGDTVAQEDFARLLQQTRGSDTVIFSCSHANLALVDDWRKLLERVLQHWSVDDWLRATRLHPAQLLGMDDRGHLASGARADIALYPAPASSSPASWSAALARCHTLIIGGRPVIENFQESQDERHPIHWSLHDGQCSLEKLTFLEEGMSLRLETLAHLAGTNGLSALRAE